MPREGRRPTNASTGLGALKPGATDAHLQTQAPRQLSEMFYGRGAFAPRTATPFLSRAPSMARAKLSLRRNSNLFVQFQKKSKFIAISDLNGFYSVHSPYSFIMNA
jgi:hypothetical protein